MPTPFEEEHNPMKAYQAYKVAYSKYSDEIRNDSDRREAQYSIEKHPPGNEHVWVTTRYKPFDPRFTAPVPRFKPVYPDGRSLPVKHESWVKVPGLPLRRHVRNNDGDKIYSSTASTR